MVSERRAFGERLKQQRERCGISLEFISQATKVPASLYEALERGDCSRWPAGIYGRAYVKAYAEAIGLKSADMVSEFSVVFGGASPPRATGAAVPRDEKAGGLRLSMAEEPAIRPEVLAKRSALAAADLVIGFLLVAVSHVGLGASVWITASCVLAYFTAGRLVSDEPLLYWLYVRMRVRGTSPVVSEPSAEEVPVGNAASTAA